MNTRFLSGSAHVLVFLAVLAVGSVVVAFQKPAPTPTPPPAFVIDPEDTEEQRQLLVQNCLMCHSEEMVATQRLTSKQWTAEVEKMVGWGSPLPVEKKEELAAYLFFLYSDKTPRVAPLRLTLDEVIVLEQPDPMAPPSVLPKGDPTRGAALYAEHCAKCHGADAKGGDLGTNLVEKPALLREADYTELLRKGRHRMPGFSSILKPEQESDLLAWLKGRRG